MNALAQQHRSVYAHIGRRIRERRKLIKLNQTELAEMMGFSYQQMQKYESGASQVSAGKLLMFAKILNVPPSYFYEGVPLEEHIGKRIDLGIIQKNRFQPLHILLVEPRPADVMLLQKALDTCEEPTEMQVVHEADAVMGCLLHYQTKYDRQRPDLVVFDIAMPRASGAEVLRAIKKHPRTQELPVVVLTNSINVKDMVDAYRLGAAGFIQKSVDFDEYAEALKVLVKYWARIVALPCV